MKPAVRRLSSLRTSPSLISNSFRCPTRIGSRPYSTSSSLPPRPSSASTNAEDEMAHVIGKFNRIDSPRVNKTVAIVTAVPLLILGYYILFPGDLENNEWHQLEAKEKERVRKALEEASQPSK